MTIFSIKINEHTKAGKALMAMLDILKHQEGVEVDSPRYNSTTEKVIKDEKEGKGLSEPMSSTKMFEELGI